MAAQYGGERTTARVVATQGAPVDIAGCRGGHPAPVWLVGTATDIVGSRPYACQPLPSGLQPVYHIALVRSGA